MAKEKDYTQVITPVVRATYLFAFRPFKSKDADEDAKPKYKVTLLFRKDKDDISMVKRAVKAALEKKWLGKPPRKMRMPIQDGDDNDDEMFHGHWVVTAASETKPEILDEDGDPCDDESVIYSGCYGKVYMGAFGYDRAGSKGVSFGFNSFWKKKDGPRLSGRMSAREAFGLDKDDGDENDDVMPKSKRKPKSREEVDEDDF